MLLTLLVYLKISPQKNVTDTTTFSHGIVCSQLFIQNSDKGSRDPCGRVRSTYEHICAIWPGHQLSISKWTNPTDCWSHTYTSKRQLGSYRFSTSNIVLSDNILLSNHCSSDFSVQLHQLEDLVILNKYLFLTDCGRISLIQVHTCSWCMNLMQWLRTVSIIIIIICITSQSTFYYFSFISLLKRQCCKGATKVITCERKANNSEINN